MEIPVHDVVNTGTELFREGTQGFINVCLARESGSQPWGFRLQGGKDRGLPFQLLKVSSSLVLVRFPLTCPPQVPLDSIASHSGCKSGDYLVKIADKDVFDLGHEEAKELIRRAGNRLSLVLERGEKIVPSMNSAFPKQKSDEPIEEKAKTYSQMVGRRGYFYIYIRAAHSPHN